MKFLLKVLVVIASLFALLLILALFVDRSFKVEKEVEVAASKEVTFQYIRNLKNQRDYGVWFELDPNIKVWYKGTPGEVGSKICWSSKKEDVGTGEQEITAIKDAERIDFKLQFFEPQKMESDVYFITNELSDNKTKITWGMNGSIPYPWNTMLLFTDMNNHVGKDFEGGLKNLKQILENVNSAQLMEMHY